MIAIVKLVDMPQRTKVIIVHTNPIVIIGFLPYLSAALPQGTAVTLWAREKQALVSPAHLAMLFCLIPNDLIIEGR